LIAPLVARIPSTKRSPRRTLRKFKGEAGYDENSLEPVSADIGLFPVYCLSHIFLCVLRVLCGERLSSLGPRHLFIPTEKSEGPLFNT
jgi:hypothetical protein